VPNSRSQCKTANNFSLELDLHFIILPGNLPNWDKMVLENPKCGVLYIQLGCLPWINDPKRIALSDSPT
jgi:hypothetical protein